MQPKTIKIGDAVYELEKTAASNWELTQTVKFTGKTKYSVFSGSAHIYKYIGPAPKKIKAPSFAAVYQLDSLDGKKDFSGFIAGNSGYISDAIKKAAGMRNKLGGAAHSYNDWGPPIGTLAGSDVKGKTWSRGKGALVWVG